VFADLSKYPIFDLRVRPIAADVQQQGSLRAFVSSWFKFAPRKSIDIA
jgi:hypothetical protein